MKWKEQNRVKVAFPTANSFHINNTMLRPISQKLVTLRKDVRPQGNTQARKAVIY